jgi:hypothetical protein
MALLLTSLYFIKIPKKMFENELFGGDKPHHLAIALQR